MTPAFKNLYLLGVLLLFTSQYSVAEVRNFQFTVALWDAPVAGESFSFAAVGLPERKNMELQKMMRSKIYVTSSPQIEILRTGKNDVKKSVIVKLDASHKCSLLVLKPNEKGYDVINIKDDPVSRAYGSYSLYNLSELDIQGKLGKSDVTLAPQSHISISPSDKKGTGLDFELWHQVEGEKKFLQRNTLTYNPNKYLIIFLHATKDRMRRVKLESRGIVALKVPQNSP